MIEIRSYNVLNGNSTHEKYKRVRKFSSFEELEKERERLQELHPGAQIAFIYTEVEEVKQC
jgi:hypothetical protein